MARLLASSSLLLPCLGLLALVSCGKDDTDGKTGDSADSAVTVDTYEAPPDNDGDGQSEADGDCDDNDATKFLGQVESCDGVDNNCNDIVDEGYGDADSDGTADCQDAEVCDGVDNNGDGTVDEGFPDADGDGHADCTSVEVCDGVDNNGDGTVDEGFDADGDGYTTCGTSTVAPDCDDTNAAVHPGATERDGNDIDDNCDGVIDVASWNSGDLLITEVMYNPQAVIDPYGEWIEVYNTTSHAVLANGLQFVSADGTSFTVASAATLTIEPGAYFVLGSDGDTGENGSVNVGYVYSEFSLGNEGDDVSVYGSDGTLLDYLYWDDGVTMPQAIGASLMVDPGYYGQTDPQYWCPATHTWGATNSGDKGSPGEINEPCSSWDHDGDGYNGDQGDCEDTRDDVYPGAYSPDATVDWDCDGIIDSAPIGGASATTTGYTCDAVYLSSSTSYDPDGDTLYYAWTLVSAPGASTKTTSDIETTTSASPTFRPDVDGTYTFGLTVNDGVIAASPVYVSVTMGARPSNSAPRPNAGADQTQTGSASCTPISYGTGGYDCDDCTAVNFSLDASGSSDPEGDDLTYSWVVTSGSASLSSSTGSAITATVSGVTATYGSPAISDTIVTLTATDCMGASATDDIQLEMQCTGT